MYVYVTVTLIESNINTRESPMQAIYAYHAVFQYIGKGQVGIQLTSYLCQMIYFLYQKQYHSPFLTNKIAKLK